MSFNIDDLTPDELDFYNRKNPVSKRDILKHLNDGKSFSDAVVTEASESLVSYYNWIKDNVKDEDKYKVTDYDNIHMTNYIGDDLTQYEKELFDTLPNIGKWQVGNYSRMWRGLEEADECLIEFIYHELDYLNSID
tara:strand:- start:51 stop:458 length:408 start_codon:yes stop_codon:yes gene_type:complete